MSTHKRSLSDWAALFEAYEQSGLSGAAFCREHGLPAPYFRTKYRRFKGQSDSGDSGFAKVQLAQAMTTPEGPNLRIRCDVEVPSDWLARLMRSFQ